MNRQENESCSYRGLEADLAECEVDNPHPFDHRLKLTKLDKLKFFINFFWLLPLRVFFLVIPSILCGVILCGIISIGIRTRQSEPLTGWRKFALQKIGVLTNKVFLFGFGFQWIKITGRPEPTEAPIMVAAPHSSILDMFFVSRVIVPTMVSRSEGARYPIFGTLVTHTMKTIFVSRDDQNSRQRCGEEIRRRANLAGEWPPVLLFPEGTTTNRNGLMRFKSGAFAPQLCVQPVLIKFKNRLNTIVWAEKGVSLVAALLLTLCNFHNSVEIEYLPPYHPSEEEKSTPSLFADNVRNVMCQAIGLPPSGYMIEDLLLGRHGEKLGLPFHTGMVEYGKKKNEIKLSFIQLKQYLSRFANFDRDKDGLISIEDMVLYLRVPQDVCAESVFNSLRPDSAGRLTFRNYVSQLVTAARPLLNNEPLLLQMFEYFDSDKDGFVNEDNLCTLTDAALSSDNLHSPAIKFPESPWNFENFKSLLQDNPEYVLLFTEHQNNASNAPLDTPHLDNGCHNEGTPTSDIIITVT